MNTTINISSTSISWHNIHVFHKYQSKFYEFNKDVNEKQIINGVSGKLESGHFLAILGSSGAGKTTLLNVLTGRNLSKVTVTGEIKLNGILANKNRIKKLSSYIQQQDQFIPFITVREHLIFQAALRLNQKLSKMERDQILESVMNELSLTKCCDTRIGSNTTFKGISGGEMKRLAFASELITNPSILFCDEPTSNLDSFMAENIVSIMKSMASKGRTIICTIHQPSSHVFEMFDQILLMTEGRVAYMGDRDGALDFFSSIGLECSKNLNPADYLIKQLAIISGKEKECKIKVDKICEEYIKKSINYEPANDIDTTNYLDKDNYQANTKAKASIYRQGSFLLWRIFLENSRNPGITYVKIAQAIFISLIMGMMFSNQKLNIKGADNMNGAIFAMMMNISISLTQSVVSIFIENYPIFYHDYSNRLYSLLPFYWSTIIVQIPLLTIFPIIFVCISYFMIGFNPSGKVFMIHLCIVILQCQCAGSIGYFISASTSSIQTAGGLTFAIASILSLFGGYFININSLPDWLSWIKYLSPYYYSFGALLINQWQDLENISCSNNSSSCVINGLNIIDNYGFHQEYFIYYILMIIVLSFGFQLIGLIVLRLSVKQD